MGRIPLRIILWQEKPCQPVRMLSINDYNMSYNQLIKSNYKIQHNHTEIYNNYTNNKVKKRFTADSYSTADKVWPRENDRRVFWSSAECQGPIISLSHLLNCILSTKQLYITAMIRDNLCWQKLKSSIRHDWVINVCINTWCAKIYCTFSCLIVLHSVF